jgi:hypothetical protein
MLRPERLALELLEYKLHDLEAGRDGAAGISAAELYGYLLERAKFLKANEQRKLKRLGEALLRLQRNPRKTKVGSLDALDIDIGIGTDGDSGKDGATQAPGASLDFALARPLGDEERREQEDLRRLAYLVWRDELSVILNRLAVSLRAEKKRQTARLIHAVLRNLAAHALQPGFARDVNLMRFKVVEGVPDASDPLVAVTDMNVVSEMLHELVGLILELKSPDSPYGALDLPAERALGYVKRLALAVARDPYAGRLSPLPQRGPTSRELRTALEELAKERLPDETKRELRQALEARLKGALAFEGTQRHLFEEDVQLYLHAVEALFGTLAQHLPRRCGGLAPEPELPGGVLFAKHQALRINAVPAGATSLTLFLKGPHAFTLAGIALKVFQKRVERGIGWFVGLPKRELEHPLNDPASDRLELDDRELLVYREGDYAHLRVSDSARSLAAVIAEARAVEFLLEVEGGLGLELLCTATGTPQAEPVITAKAALRRLQTLFTKVPDRRAAVKSFLLGAAAVVQSEVAQSFLEGLTERLYIAMTAAGAPLDAILASVEGEVAVYDLKAEPIAFSAAGALLTLRRSGAKDLVLMRSGRPLGSFRDYLLTPFAGGSLLAARSTSQVAVIFTPGGQA